MGERKQAQQQQQQQTTAAAASVMQSTGLRGCSGPTAVQCAYKYYTNPPQAPLRTLSGRTESRARAPPESGALHGPAIQYTNGHHQTLEIHGNPEIASNQSFNGALQKHGVIFQSRILFGVHNRCWWSLQRNTFMIKLAYPELYRNCISSSFLQPLEAALL